MPTGFNLKANAIDGTVEIPEADDTGFTDNGYGSAQPAGPVRCTGNVGGFTRFNTTSTTPLPAALLASTLAPSNAQGSMTLQFTTGCTLAFTANITGWSFSRNLTDSMTSSYPFGSVGQLTLTWDETA
jgi:hypothetical protein